jgi:tRNA nucleotidyltransferase (CCA-adding enzyme)
VVSAESLARFQHHARDFLADPRVAAFESRDPEPMAPEEVREHVRRRGTAPVALSFRAPDVVEDQLYPQLRRSRSNLTAELRRRGFQPLRARAFAEPPDGDRLADADAGDPHETGDTTDGGASSGARRAVILVECAVGSLPAVERHEGPPVAVRDHAAGFYEKYADGDAYGPFLDGDRYVVERSREYTTPAAAVAGVLSAVGLGPDVERAVEDDHTVLAGEELGRLAERPGLAVELRRYFEPRP